MGRLRETSIARDGGVEVEPLTPYRNDGLCLVAANSLERVVADVAQIGLGLVHRQRALMAHAHDFDAVAQFVRNHVATVLA